MGIAAWASCRTRRSQGKEAADGGIYSEALALAFEGEGAGLAGGTSEEGPDLSHGGAGGGSAVDGEEEVARLDVGHGGFALVVGDADDGVAAIRSGAKGEADDIHVGSRSVGGGLKVERGVRVVDANAIGDQGVRSDQAQRGKAGALLKPLELFFRKTCGGDVDECCGAELDVGDAQQRPAGFFRGPPHIAGTDTPNPVRQRGLRFVPLCDLVGGQQSDRRAQVEGKIKVLRVDFAGDLDEAGIWVEQNSCVRAPEGDGAGRANSELAVGKVEEYIVVAEHGGREGDFGAAPRSDALATEDGFRVVDSGERDVRATDLQVGRRLDDALFPKESGLGISAKGQS